MGVSTLMMHVADFAIAAGGAPMMRHAGCWETPIDQRWWIAVNGHREAVPCSHGVEVPPFSAYVEYNGFPAGIFSAFGGAIAAGSAANEDALIAALADATAKAKAR